MEFTRLPRRDGLIETIKKAVDEVRATSVAQEHGPLNKALNHANTGGKALLGTTSSAKDGPNTYDLSALHASAGGKYELSRNVQIAPRSLFIAKYDINAVLNSNRLWYGYYSAPETGARVLKLLKIHLDDPERIKIAMDFQHKSNAAQYLQGRVAFAELVYQAQMRLFEEDIYVTGTMTNHTYDALKRNRQLFYRSRKELYEKYKRRFRNRIQNALEESRDALADIQNKLYILDFTPNKHQKIIEELQDAAEDIKDEMEDLVDLLDSGESKDVIQVALSSILAGQNPYAALAAAATLILSWLLSSTYKVTELGEYTRNLLTAVSKTDLIILAAGEREYQPPTLQDVVDDSNSGAHGFDPEIPLDTLPDWADLVRDLNELRLMKPPKGGGGPDQDPDPRWNELIARIKRALKRLRNRADNNLGILRRQWDFVNAYYRKLTNPTGKGMN